MIFLQNSECIEHSLDFCLTVPNEKLISFNHVRQHGGK